ncbi:MAG: tetratricopeptide repeat protein [Alphaproteobacteria bacterium]
MTPALLVMIAAAVLTAGAAAWVLRAYRLADGGAVVRPGPALAACGLAGVAALGLYLVLGRPELPDMPYAQRIATLHQRDPATLTLDEMVALLHESARAHPADPQPHLLTGMLMLNTGHFQEAAQAYDAALRRNPDSVEAMMGLGRAMVQVDQGRVSPEALRLFEAAARADNADPTPWLYQAMAAMQQSHDADARRLFQEALKRMAPNDPRRAMEAQFRGGAR